MTMKNNSLILRKPKMLFLWGGVLLVIWLLGVGCAKDPVPAELDIEANPNVNVHNTPVGHNGKLSVVGPNLVNQHGEAIQLRGMSTHGLQWYDQCVTDTSLDVLADDWGADMLRLSLYVQEGGYLTNPTKFTEIVDGMVDQVNERGMYAIIDWHQLDPGDPMYNVEHAKVYFEHMSKTHAGKPVFYEICNEPNRQGMDFDPEWSDIAEYANIIIPIIRANDPDSVIIVGTPVWGLYPSAVIGAELPYENILYSMHFYAASHTEEHDTWPQDNLRESIAAGLPLFITEFGSQTSSGGGDNDFPKTETWMQILADAKISWTNWNFSDDVLSGAVWNLGTCTTQDWSDYNLKEAGVWIKHKIGYPSDAFDKDRSVADGGV